MFDETDLAHQQRLKCAFDPDGLLNPGKVFPTLHRCAELGRLHVHRGRAAAPGPAAVLIRAPISGARNSRPPQIGCGAPVVVGRLSGKPPQRAHREIGESLRFERVAVPADRLDRADRVRPTLPSPASGGGSARRSPSPRRGGSGWGLRSAHRRAAARAPHDRRVAPSAAADQPFARRRREMPDGGGDRGGGHLGQGRGAVRDARDPRASRRGNRRGRAISAACARNTDAPETARHALPRPARRSASAPSKSAARPVCRRTQSSISALPGPVSKARISSGPSPIQVTLPTPPRFSTASGFRQPGGERGVVERRERRPLPARGDIGAAEIADDIDPGQLRQQRAVADLPGAALLRAGAGSCGRETRSARSRFADIAREIAPRLRHAAGSARPRPRRSPRGRRRRARRAACSRNPAGYGNVSAGPGNRLRARRRSPAPRHRCRRARCRSSAPPHDADLC